MAPAAPKPMIMSAQVVGSGAAVAEKLAPAEARKSRSCRVPFAPMIAACGVSPENEKPRSPDRQGGHEAGDVHAGPVADVVRQVAQGQRKKEIARSLGISEGTVKMHLHNLYEKLGVSSRTELALLAKEQGLD